MKKLLVLLLCLALALSALVACSGDDSSNQSSAAGGSSNVDSGNADNSSTADGGSTDKSSTVDSGNTDNSSNVDSGNTDNSSTVDSGNTDNSSTVDSGNTDNSSTVDSGNTDNSGTTDSTGKDDGGTDDREKITIKFTCFSGTHVSGEKEIKIDKGSVILAEQMPVITRNEYVLFWAYDMFGEELWKASDVFENDDELFGVWKTEAEAEEVRKEQALTFLVDYCAGLNNYKAVETVTAIVNGGSTATYTSVFKQNGTNQSQVITGQGVSSGMWYVDGVYYLNGDGIGNKKCQLTYEEFLEKTGAASNEDSIFGVPVSNVKSIGFVSGGTGIRCEMVVDGEKMSGSTYTYSDMSYVIYFDSYGSIYSMTASYTYTDGENTVQYGSLKDFSGIGKTVVNPPENADEFEDYPGLLG